MTEVSLNTLHRDLRSLQKDIQFIKHVIAEDFELSKEAKKQLDDARETPRTEYINQEEMEKEFLR